jgi:hypothetical protein
MESKKIPSRSKRNLPHVTYPHPKGMGHYGHIKTGNFQETLTTFDAPLQAAGHCGMAS